MINTENLVPSTAQQSTLLNVIKYVLFYDGGNTYTVSKDFYDTVQRQVEDILPALIPGERYTLRMLYGKALWDQLSDGSRRMAGRCMTDIIMNKYLPLNFAKSRHEYPKYYQLA